MHRTVSRLAALGAALTLLALGTGAAFAQNASPQPTAPPGNASRGHAAFLSYGCYECHGTAGQGNYGAGARIAPKPPAWPVVSSYVRRPRGDMPSFSQKILSDSVLADIYAYLSSIGTSKSGADQPLLNNTTLKAK